MRRVRSSNTSMKPGEIAPRTPHRSHIQEDGTIQLFRPPESRRAPRVPIHRLRNSPLEVRRIVGDEVVQFLLRRCGSRPGQAENNRQRENHSHETSDQAGGNKFQSASFHIQRGEPLLIAECPEIHLSSIHGDRETGLAILRAAFLNVEIVNLPTGCCDAFSAGFARGTSER